jgi:hypothetical protein
MPRKAALFISLVFHPILIPLISIYLLLHSGSFISFISPQTKKAIYLIFVAGTFVLPLFSTLLLWLRGYISNIHLSEKSDRILPYSMTFIYYLFTYYLLLKIPIYHFLHSFMLGALISVLLLTVLNFQWKVSAHMTGMGGLVALILASSLTLHVNLLPFLIISVLISGMVATSRLILNSHTAAEVYGGFFLGFATMLIVVMI